MSVSICLYMCICFKSVTVKSSLKTFRLDQGFSELEGITNS